MTDLLKLHTQDLIDVMVQTDRSNNALAGIVWDLANRGIVYPLNEMNLGPLRQEGRIFQRDAWKSPILCDQLPLEDEFSFDQVKQILLDDVGSEEAYCFAPSHNSRKEDARAILELISNIDNPQYSEPGAILLLHSPTFEHYCRHKPNWAEDGMPGVSQVTMAVTPVNDVQDMKFHDNHMLSTLPSGIKIWAVYPPTQGNMEALQTHFHALVNGSEDYAMHHASNFEHGIIFIQSAGETLILPPFWMATALCTVTAVSCTFHIATALTFEERLKQIGNFRLTTQIDLSDDTQGPQILFSFANDLLEHLRAILKNNFTACDVGQVTINICRDYETYRTSFRSIFQASGNRAVAQELEGKYRTIWLDFIEKKRKQKAACRLCNLRIQDMPTGDSPTDRLRQHFIDFHCVSRNRYIERIARK
ncbi:hypothetical protein E8E13_011013 [Curvularia kusanoi]|uniref:JmjC domain-containing protein n=1 Tax=Curvularia kusanoi TaxID=90978 RepID=A0A9P4TK11_CURKU|nr:hypothetical protein E8E13_011013 [Curvularia kusanoi]